MERELNRCGWDCDDVTAPPFADCWNYYASRFAQSSSVPRHHRHTPLQSQEEVGLKDAKVVNACTGI